MKLKKLFAGVVAAAMMLTMAVPAFAATEKGNLSLSADNTYTIQKSYELIGEGSSPAEEFNFTIVATKTSHTSVTVAEAPVPTITSSVTYAAGDATVGGTATNSVKDIVINFAPNGNLIYNKVGVYEYKLEETIPADASKNLGVEYDKEPVTLKVYVVNEVDGNNEPTGKLKISEISLTKKNKKITGLVEGGTNNNAAFVNKYTANKLNVAKKVYGDAADRDMEFNFKVSFTNESGKAWTNAITVKKGDAVQTINPADNVYTITLKHGESMDFTNIPAGLKYTVSEMDNATANASALDSNDTFSVNGTQYTVKYDNAKSGEMEGTALNTLVKNIAEGFIDTGVILDNAPYIALLTIVAVGAVFMVIKKRRTDED